MYSSELLFTINAFCCLENELACSFQFEGLYSLQVRGHHHHARSPKGSFVAVSIHVQVCQFHSVVLTSVRLSRTKLIRLCCPILGPLWHDYREPRQRPISFKFEINLKTCLTACLLSFLVLKMVRFSTIWEVFAATRATVGIQRWHAFSQISENRYFEQQKRQKTSNEAKLSLYFKLKLYVHPLSGLPVLLMLVVVVIVITRARFNGTHFSDSIASIFMPRSHEDLHPPNIRNNGHTGFIWVWQVPVAKVWPSGCGWKHLW